MYIYIFCSLLCFYSLFLFIICLASCNILFHHNNLHEYMVKSNIAQIKNWMINVSQNEIKLLTVIRQGNTLGEWTFRED